MLILKEAGTIETKNSTVSVREIAGCYIITVPVTQTSKLLVDMCRLQSRSAILYEDHVEYMFVDNSSIEIDLY